MGIEVFQYIVLHGGDSFDDAIEDQFRVGECFLLCFWVDIHFDDI